ncbi:MAG: adenylate kinase [Actinomycetota bacterium]|nr:adenylate kinase [Actinomycetota bacterium]
MRVLFIGGPGAGKGTQSARMAAFFGLTHLSSGDLLRKHIAEGTKLGQRVKAYMDRGDLVPDQIVMDMLRKPVLAASRTGGYILDGFPRTAEQAEAAYLVASELGVEVQVAVHLYVEDRVLIERLLSRGRGADDNDRAVIVHRIEVYNQQTTPLVDYYAVREELININGGRSVDEVSWELVSALQSRNIALAARAAKTS